MYNRVFDHDGFSGEILKNQLKVARQEACLNNNFILFHRLDLYHNLLKDYTYFLIDLDVSNFE